MFSLMEIPWVHKTTNCTLEFGGSCPIIAFRLRTKVVVNNDLTVYVGMFSENALIWMQTHLPSLYVIIRNVTILVRVRCTLFLSISVSISTYVIYILCTCSQTINTRFDVQK